MTKAPIPTEMTKGQSDNTNNAPKSSITQRLRTDLGRSVGVATHGEVKPVYGRPPSHNSYSSKGHTFKKM